MRATFLVTLTLLTTALAACTDASAPDSPGPPAAQRVASVIVSTNGQSAFRGRALPRALQVLVTEGGSAVKGIHVAWRPAQGAVTADTTVTGPDGVAEVAWILGPAAGTQTLDASVEGVSAPVRFTATALPVINLLIESESDNQVGVAGAPIPTPLRVKLFSDGEPTSGIVVAWQQQSPFHGTITYSTSGPDGIASLAPSLPTLAGSATYSAEAAADALGVVGKGLFHVQVLAAAPAAITFPGGTPSIPVNRPQPMRVWAHVADQFGNAIVNAPVSWQVSAGPFSITNADGSTGEDGNARATIQPIGPVGDGRVTATTYGGITGETEVQATPAIPYVVLEVAYPSSGFRSGLNGSSPAVDSIPAGTTMTWFLSDEDLDSHTVAPVGEPGFPAVSLGYGSTVNGATVTFTTPGTYHYQDAEYPGTIGTLVVQ